MKLVAIYVFKWREDNSVRLAEQLDLTGFWFHHREVTKQFIRFSARTVATRVPPGHKASAVLEQNTGVCYCCTAADGLCTVAIADTDYPEKSAFLMLAHLAMDFREAWGDRLDRAAEDADLGYPGLPSFFAKWQDPTEADKLAKIEKELHLVKDVVHQNLVNLLKRGEQLEDLVAKSKDLNKVSVDFYRKAKKTNSRCCPLQ